MQKTIDDINILRNEDSLTLINAKNDSIVNLDLKKGSIIFHDLAGNIIQNCPSTIRINFEIFHLTAIGQIINRDNHKIIAYLSTTDVQELAENTFYEEEQIRVYDFIKLKFKVPF